MKKSAIVFVYFLLEVNGICNYEATKKTMMCINTNIQEIQSFQPDDEVHRIQIFNSTITEIPPHFLAFKDTVTLQIQSGIEKIHGQSFTDLNRISTLDLSQNFLSGIPSDLFLGLTELRTLSLDRNELRNPTAETFDGLGKLHRLDLSHNKITYIIEEAFHVFSELEVLKVSHNAIAELDIGTFDNSHKLNHLDLSHNQLSFIFRYTFDDMQSLKYLNLSHNKLQGFQAKTFERAQKIKILDLSTNDLEIYPEVLKNIKDLEHLNISNNRLHNLTVIPNKYLISLDLSHNLVNTIHNLTFTQLKNLITLNLSYNKLQSLQPNTFNHNLESLDLSYNSLVTIELNVLNIPTLKTLYLNNNKILNLNALTFKTTKFSLRTIDVRRNHLNYIVEELFDWIPNVETFEIGGNPWECSCLTDLVNVLTDRYISYSVSPYFNGEMPSCIVSENTNCSYQRIYTKPYELIVDI